MNGPGYEGGTRRYKTAIVLTVTDSNAVTADPIDAYEVMLHARTAAVRVNIDPAPDASVSYDFILEAGERLHVQLNANSDKIAALRDAATSGVLIITPCSLAT